MTESAFATLKVLVAEDNAFTLDVIVAALGGLGVGKVLTAKDGAEALERLAAAAPPVNLVISDIEMPGIDGHELARRLRSGELPGYKDVPFLMLTNRGGEESLRESRAHRIQGYIVKPPSAEMLELCIRRALKLP